MSFKPPKFVSNAIDAVGDLGMTIRDPTKFIRKMGRGGDDGAAPTAPTAPTPTPMAAPPTSPVSRPARRRGGMPTFLGTGGAAPQFQSNVGGKTLLGQ